MSVHVLRLGHRPSRDKRVSTHLILAARAFGAKAVIYTGKRDPYLESSIKNVVKNWGGDFSLNHSSNWKKTIEAWQGKVVHLTMYGLPFQHIVGMIRKDSCDKLIVVGGAKVPSEIYGLVNWNLAVTSQPHSEVSALAVFLHELLEGKELDHIFERARLHIIPQEHGKRVEERKNGFNI